MPKRKLSSKGKARRMAATGMMLHNKAKTFKAKVSYVKKHMPEITNPEAFVAAAVKATKGRK
jgi:hypothetical protein